MTEKLSVVLADLKEEEALIITRQKIEAKEDPIKVLESARAGMTSIGERFEKGEYFLSELVYASEIFKGIMEIVEPELKKVAPPKPLGKLVIGTVEGDIHNLGKDIFTTLMKAEGFEVADLGVDVPAEKFIEAIKKNNPEIVGMSGLITLCIESMKKTVDTIKDAGLREKVKIIIGGGRANEYAREYIGSDAWADDAARGVRLCKEFLGR